MCGDEGEPAVLVGEPVGGGSELSARALLVLDRGVVERALSRSRRRQSPRLAGRGPRQPAERASVRQSEIDRRVRKQLHPSERAGVLDRLRRRRARAAPRAGRAAGRARGATRRSGRRAWRHARVSRSCWVAWCPSLPEVVVAARSGGPERREARPRRARTGLSMDWCGARPVRARPRGRCQSMSTPSRSTSAKSASSMSCSGVASSVSRGVRVRASSSTFAW